MSPVNFYHYKTILTMKKKTLFYNLILPVLSILVVVGVWAVVAAIYDKPLVFPNVDVVFIDFFKLFAVGEFYAGMAMTFLRSAACFALALLIALPLAYAASKNRVFFKILQPLMGFLRSIPVIAVILVTLIMFSSSFLPVVVGFLTIFPLSYSAYLQAFTTDEMQQNLEMCKLYKVKSKYVIKYVYLPTLLPSTFTQSESLLPLAIKVVISGEVLAYAKTGIGLLMRSAQLNVETSKLVAYAFIATLLSFLALLLAKLCRLICRRLRLCR